jgi:protein-tyrosine phosphatase
LSDSTYRILMVCTGNICRSPVMERLLVARLRERLGAQAAARFEIGSCGTWAMLGEQMSPEALATLVDLGGDGEGFTPRELTADLVGADLILTATREHRGRVVSEVPRAAARTLTLREFARLLGRVTAADIAAQAASDDPVDRMRAIVAAAFANRGLVPADDPADDDIADPYRRDRAAFTRAAREIDAALSVPLALLAPTPSG